MIDWNGDGKIDPVDVGITMALLDDEADEEEEQKGSAKRGGCLTTLIMLFCLAIIGVVSICTIFL